MSLQWFATVAAPACGLIGILAVWLCRGFRLRQWTLPLPGALVLFLGFSVLPPALVFCVYPFLDPQPELDDFFPVLPVAGISLLWTVFATFRQGFFSEALPGRIAEIPKAPERTAS